MIKIYKYGEVSNDEIFARGEEKYNVEGAVADIIANVRANGDAAYKSSQDLTEKFISVIQQDARNIVSVKEAYFELDTEIKTQLRSLTEK